MNAGFTSPIVFLFKAQRRCRKTTQLAWCKFHDYLSPLPPQKVRRALIDLFEMLDTPIAERDPYLDLDLAAFPYVNGGLFGARSSSPLYNNSK